MVLKGVLSNPSEALQGLVDCPAPARARVRGSNARHRPGLSDGAERDDDRVVELTDDRDEGGDKVQWQREVFRNVP